MESVLSFANSAIAVVVVIGLCLFFHEAGHFLAAKASRVGVYEFAMGFGPTLWRRTWRGTVYALRAIPFGGFVRIAGMEPGEREIEHGLYTRPKWQILSVFCAGTFMNVVLAVLVYWVVNVFSGVAAPDQRDVIIRNVFSDTPAQRAGVQPGDKIIGVGDSRFSSEVREVAPGSVGQKMGLQPGARVFQVGEAPVATPADVLRALRAGLDEGQKVWVINPEARGIEDAVLGLDPPPAADLSEVPEDLDIAAAPAVARRALGVSFADLDQFTVHRFISANPSTPLTLTVMREDAVVELQVTPGATHDRFEMVAPSGKLLTPHRMVGRIGISLGPQLRRAGPIEGLKLAVAQSVNSVATVVLSIKAMIAGKIAAEPAGPVGIMAMTADAAKLGWASVLALCGLISANLAVINMIPIPPFDGFHVTLLGIEAAIRRRVNERLEMAVRLAGFALIIALFLALTSKDIANLIRFGTY